MIFIVKDYEKNVLPNNQAEWGWAKKNDGYSKPNPTKEIRNTPRSPLFTDVEPLHKFAITPPRPPLALIYPPCPPPKGGLKHPYEGFSKKICGNFLSRKHEPLYLGEPKSQKIYFVKKFGYFGFGGNYISILIKGLIQALEGAEKLAQ